MLLKTNGKKVKVGDLVAYRFFGGEWDRSKKETDWKENDYPFFYSLLLPTLEKREMFLILAIQKTGLRSNGATRSIRMKIILNGIGLIQKI